ncbi:MAG TPA: hypothetical protein VKU01_24660 [Bryobacteraceae bacterium]|nr:hypothetical protein [Bryobacteraceae bacterium]
MTQALHAMLEEYSLPLMRKCLAQALEGDAPAMRLCMERLLPLRRDAPIRAKLPPIEQSQDVAAAQQAILKAVGQGQMTPSEGETISNIVERRRRSIETAELALRLDELEKKYEPEERR